MSDVVIRAQGLGKKYLIGHQAPAERYTALRDVIGRTAKGFLRAVRDTLHGRQLVAGEEIEEFWALRDVSFEVRRGEVLGIIGRNGAGKSTLLKVLSRITEPSAGRVEIRGRIASLLEVGTGFHPELTGRENIFLNGAVLGMSRAEIGAKFDEIVAFAEVERFLDTPVKRYSSGMYVRLAFAVAAHLEPEILIIDEVLAVGDAEFQRKCLGKMQDVAGGDGRTVLFVSHNLAAVSTICSRALVFDAGRIAAAGDVDRTVAAYIASTRSASGAVWTGSLGDDDVQLLAASANQSGSQSQMFVTDKPIDIALDIALAQPLHGLIVQLRLFASDGRLLLLSGFDDEDGARASTTAAGRYGLVATLPADFLAKGSYRAEVWIGIHNTKVIVGGEAAVMFDVENTSGIGRKYLAGGPAENVIRPRLNWHVHAAHSAAMRSTA